MLFLNVWFIFKMVIEKRKGFINEVWNENIILKKIRIRKICEGCKI